MEQLSKASTDINIRNIAEKSALKRAEAKVAALLDAPIRAEIQEYQ